MSVDPDTDASHAGPATTGPGPRDPAAVMPPRAAGVPLWVLALTAAVVLAVVLGTLALLSGGSLPARNGPAIEEVAVERTVLRPGVIELTVRNTGPDPVQIAQVSVNDVFVDVEGGLAPLGRLGTATLALDHPWQDGQPYVVSMLTSTGLVIETT